MSNAARYAGFLPPGGSFDAAGEYVTDCPRCLGRKKFYWNPEKGKGKCWGGKPVPCRTKVLGEDEYRALFSGQGQATGLHLVPRDYVEAPKEAEKQALVQDPWHYPSSRAFLGGEPPKGRGLSREIVKDSGMGGDGRRIWVDLEPVCRNHAPYRYHRAADGSSPWMPKKAGVRRQSYVYGLSKWSEREPWGQVVLFEGVFDVLGSGLLGRALGLMGSALSHDLARYLSEECGVVRAYYWPDPDEAGQDGARKAVEVLGGWGIDCALVDTVDKQELNPKFVPPAEVRRILGELGWSE